MKYLNKGIKFSGLVLLCSVLGVCVANNANNHQENEQLHIVEKHAQAEAKVPEIQIWGDYDRMFSKPGIYKDTYQGEHFEWKDAPICMHYVNDTSSTPYYRAVLNLKAGDKILGRRLDKLDNDSNAYIRYSSLLGDNFKSDGTPDNNIVCKVDGTYVFTYKASQLDKGNISEGWISPQKITLDPVMLNWKYTDSTFDPGVMHVIIQNDPLHTMTQYSTISQKQFVAKDGMYSEDVSLAIANGYYTFSVKDNSLSNQTADLDYYFLQDLDVSQKCYLEIDTKGGKRDATWKTSQNDTNPTKVLTNQTARVWVDPQNTITSNDWLGLHIWDEKGSVEFFPTSNYNLTRGANTSRVMYFDIPTKYFENNFKYMFKGYSYTTGKCVTTSEEFNNNNLNPNEMVYLSLNNNKTTVSQGNATDESKKIPAIQLKTVFEAYYTCSESDLNGYGDFETLFLTWCGYEYNFVEGMLGDIKINDFGSLKQDDYATGANKTNEVDIYSKISKMNELYYAGRTANKLTAFMQNSNVVIVVVVASIVAVSALAISLIFIKRKKHVRG